MAIPSTYLPISPTPYTGLGTAAATPTPSKRSRVKLPPRITHYALVKPWAIYVETADGKDPDAMQWDGWIAIVAKNAQDAEAKARNFYRSTKHG